MINSLLIYGRKIIFFYLKRKKNQINYHKISVRYIFSQYFFKMKVFKLNYEGYWREKNFPFLPSKPGVYTFMECRYSPLGETVDLVRILYIGQADDLKERINGHEKIALMKRSLKPGNELCLNLSIVNDERDRIENALIYHHKPPFNEMLKDSFNHDKTSIFNLGNYSLLSQAFTVARSLPSSNWLR